MSPVAKYSELRWVSLRLRWLQWAWWRHQMETFSALLAICAGNSAVPGEFPAQRPVTRSFDGFFDLRLSKRLSKQSWGWWLEALSSPLWRHRDGSQWSYNNLALGHGYILKKTRDKSENENYAGHRLNDIGTTTPTVRHIMVPAHTFVRECC